MTTPAPTPTPTPTLTPYITPTPTPTPTATPKSTPIPFLNAYGEWVQVQWATPSVLGSYQIAPRYGTLATTVFQSFMMLGSNDGSTWYFIHASTAPLMWATNTPNTFYVTPMQAYSYFRLVVTQATPTAEIGGWYLYDIYGNPLISWGTLSGNTLVQNGSVAATLSWSWSNAMQSSTSQPFPYILFPTNYASTYLGFLAPSEYPSANNGLVTTSAPSTAYSFLTSVATTENVYGEWVQVQFATPIVATNLILYPKSGSINVPQAIVLLALSGSTWTYLMSATNLVWLINEPLSFSIPTTSAYASYRIVVTQAINTAWEFGGVQFMTATGLALPSGTYTYTGTPVLNGNSTQTSGTYTCNPTGGTGSYTYAWSATGGNVVSVVANAPTSATTTFTAVMKTGPASTSTASCLVLDTVDGDSYTITSPITWQPYYLHLTVTIAAVPAPTPTLFGPSTQTSPNYTATVSGGSGQYSFVWSAFGGNVSAFTYSTVSSTNASSSIANVTGIMMQGPASTSTLRCTATDVNDNESAFATTTVYWQPYYSVISAVINAPPTPTPVLVSTLTQTSGTYTCVPSKGSGSYSYLWSTLGGNVSAITIANPTSASTTFTATMNTGPSSTTTVSCFVTDTVSGNTYTTSSTVTWQPYYILVPVMSPTPTPTPTAYLSMGGATQTSATYTATVSGGSGQYAFVWSTSGGNVNSVSISQVNATSGVSSSAVATASMKLGPSSTTTLTCTITDTYYGLTTVTSAPILWQAYMNPQTYGEWVQVQWTSAKVLGSYQIAPRSGATSTVFRAFDMLGSNDGAAWYFIHASTTPLVWASNAPNTFYVTPMQAYSYYRLVVTQANTTAEIGGWYLYDVSGNPFALSTDTVSGGNNQYLQQSGTTVATLSWSWSNAMQSSTSQPFAYILTPTNYASTYLGFLAPTEYPAANNGVATTSAPVTTYAFLTATSASETAYGEWLQVQFAASLVATSVALYPKSGSMNVPNAFLLLGSTNGTAWTYLMSTANLFWSANTPMVFTIPNTSSFAYYRLVVTQAQTSIWDLGGFVFSTSSGLALPGSYTYSGTSGSIAKSGASTVATLSWSWATMDGAPTNTAAILAAPMTTWVGVSAPTEYLASANGVSNTLAPAVAYTNAPMPSITQTVYGEWIQVQLTNPVVLTSFMLVPYTLSKMVQSFFMLGSNDGTTWTYLMSNTNQVLWSNGPSEFTTTTMYPYAYYRFVVTQAPSVFDIKALILVSVNGPVFPSSAYYTMAGNLLQWNGQTLAKVTWSWTNAYTESTTQTVANLLTNDGYTTSPAFLGCTNAAEYPAANNGYVTTSAPSTVYNYIVPNV